MRTNRILTIVIALAVYIPLFANTNDNKENLYGRTWCEIDSTTGSKLNTEFFFDKDGLVLCCTMAENENQSRPTWDLCNYSISEKKLNIEHRRQKNLNQTINYEIVKLSNDTLVLLSQDLNKVSYRTFLTQSAIFNSIKTIDKNSTFSILTAKQWQYAKPMKFLTKWHRWYFAENKWFLVDFKYNNQSKKWEQIEEAYDYYLADWADHNFSRSQLSKKRENGNFLNYYKEHKRRGKTGGVIRSNIDDNFSKIQSLSYKIVFLSNDILLLESVPIEYHTDRFDLGDTHKCYLICY